MRSGNDPTKICPNRSHTKVSVTTYTAWRAHPGRTADFLKAAKAGQSIHERLGGRGVLAAHANAGPASGSYTYGLIFPDLASWGSWTEALRTDEEWQALVRTEVQSLNTPAVMVSQHMAADQPGFEIEAPAPGSFLLTQVIRMAPGRKPAEVTALGTDVRALCLEHGATAMTLQRVTAGGDLTSSYLAIYTFASAIAYAEWSVRYGSDPRYQALVERGLGSNALFSATTFSHARVMGL